MQVLAAGGTWLPPEREGARVASFSSGISSRWRRKKQAVGSVCFCPGPTLLCKGSPQRDCVGYVSPSPANTRLIVVKLTGTPSGQKRANFFERPLCVGPLGL